MGVDWVQVRSLSFCALISKIIASFTPANQKRSFPRKFA